MPSGHCACYYYPLVHVACIRKHHALALSTGTRSRIVPLLARNKASSLVRYGPPFIGGRQDDDPRDGTLGNPRRLERHIEVSANSCYSCYTLELSNDNRRLHKWRNVTRRRPSAKNHHLCNQSITNQPPRDILGRESIARSTSTNAKAN